MPLEPRVDRPERDAAPAAERTPLLQEFAALWSRGLADEDRLWRLFDVCELYLLRPDYFGAPVFRTEHGLVSPVFSSFERLVEFVFASPELGPESGAEDFAWVQLTGAKFFGLPVRARMLAIDPGVGPGVPVDLARRLDPPPLAGAAPPFAIDLELSDDGEILRSGASARMHAEQTMER